jgi:hypothetical protein
MRTLIYKRTHSGDPDPKTGTFGSADCMGRVRGWNFDAIIGVGGIGREPALNGVAGKVTWVGIGPHKVPGQWRGPLVTFDHFTHYGERGPLLRTIAPALAKRVLGRNVRAIMNGLSNEERREVARILDMARDAPPSRRGRKRRGPRPKACGRC